VSDPPLEGSRPNGTAGLASHRRARWLRGVLGAAISVLLGVLVFAGTDLEEVWGQMRRFSAASLLGALAFSLLAIPPRAVQWQWLLGSPRAATFPETLRCLCLGYLGNCLLPMRGGELVRTYLLARAASLPISRVLVSVVLSRLQDFLPVLLVLVAAFAVIDFGDSVTIGGRGFLASPVEVPTGQLRGALKLFAAAVGIGAVCMGVGFVWLGTVERLLLRLCERLPRRAGRLLEQQVAEAADALRVIGRANSFGAAQLLAIGCWGIFALVAVPLVMSWGIGVGHAFEISIAVLGMSSVAQMLPSLPGAIGTSHAASVVTLRLMRPDLEPGAAVAFALVFHFISTIVPGLVGVLYLPATWNRFVDALVHRGSVLAARAASRG